MFTWNVVTFSWFAFAVICYHLYLVFLQLEWPNIVTIFLSYPIDLMLLLFCFAAGWFVGGLCSFHFYLSCTNQSTYEELKKHFASPADNPFFVSYESNCLKKYCGSKPPNFVDFSKYKQNESWEFFCNVDMEEIHADPI